MQFLSIVLYLALLVTGCSAFRCYKYFTKRADKGLTVGTCPPRSACGMDTQDGRECRFYCGKPTVGNNSCDFNFMHTCYCDTDLCTGNFNKAFAKNYDWKNAPNNPRIIAMRTCIGKLGPLIAELPAEVETSTSTPSPSALAQSTEAAAAPESSQPTSTTTISLMTALIAFLI